MKNSNSSKFFRHKPASARHEIRCIVNEMCFKEPLADCSDFYRKP